MINIYNLRNILFFILNIILIIAILEQLYLFISQLMPQSPLNQSNQSNPYIDNLYQTLLKFNEQSMEIKKLYVPVVFGTGILINLLLKSEYNSYFFDKLRIIPYMIFSTMIFWVLDSSNYFFQRDIRKQINSPNNRNTSNNTQRLKIAHCMLNRSMIMYHVILILLIEYYCLNI